MEPSQSSLGGVTTYTVISSLNPYSNGMNNCESCINISKSNKLILCPKVRKNYEKNKPTTKKILV